MNSSHNNGPLIKATSCRCCGSIRSCRLFDVVYEYRGREEIYSEIMSKCFGLTLLQADDSKVCICAPCVVRLRDAHAFKEQVMKCEAEFLKTLQEITEEVENLKEQTDEERLTEILSGNATTSEELGSDIENTLDEMNTLEEENNAECKLQEVFGDDDATYEALDSDLDEEIEGLEKENEYTKSEEVLNDKFTYKELNFELPNIKTTKTRHTINGFINNDPSDKNIRVVRVNKDKIKSATKRKKRKAVKASVKLLSKKAYSPFKDRRYNKEKYLSVSNVITLIECSYVCPFQNRQNNFYCFYCKTVFTRPEELREHNLKHDPRQFRDSPSYRCITKIDIGTIDCRLCTKKIDNLEEFKQHITQAHGRIFHDVPDNFIPFRASFHNPTCLVCDKTFFQFSALYRHAVIHYGRYTCEICGKCFLDDALLYHHMKHFHTSDTHTCEYCGKRFKHKYSKKFHIDTIHENNPPVECPRCDEKFMTYNQKNKHLVEFHGESWPKFPCKLCDRVYRRPKALAEHIRRYHFQVKNHECELCGKKFYVPCKLREHLAIHNGERNYQCEHCDKAYTSVKALQAHMKIHFSDRLMCEECGHTFTQIASLRNHMNSHHSIASDEFMVE
ncbi:Zinc finger protein 57 [Eumeta japonica]|uniref:Zinc finger protein 57 n=1 Tax=Eumeta variegata TaxID=151549 RepID=A0A4C1V457_EUMVA|nr:Zinc finger protein 57 [Eumeta japonica]